ncbi:MAG: arginine--tRNA ligase [Neisseriaceae bacterium]|nr:MAG: arginine--tRNA ligase [Neisseriaceae bacterium]
MNMSDLLTDMAKEAFEQVGIGEYPVVLQPVKSPQFGDYQINGVIAAAKRIQRNPRELADKVVQYLDKQDIIQSLEVAGPGFINIRLDGHFLNQQVNLMLEDNRLGVKPSLHGKKIVIDYSSPNLAKEMHVGHLRSTIIGDSLNRIYQFMGANVIPQNHVGDWGTQFGMLVAYLIEQEQKSESEFILSDLEVFYRQAKKKFDEDKSFADLARGYVLRLQNNDPEILKYWKKFVETSIEHIQAIYQRLGVLLTRDDIFGESEYNEELPKIVNLLLEKGIAVTDDNGTKLVYLEDLRDENDRPGVLIIQKQDGGYLYATTDFACLKTNIQDHHATHLIYVVDSRQELHFKSLFNISERAGWLPENVLAEHVAFGTIMGDDGKPFKTRDGKTIKLVDLLNEAVSRAKDLIQSKNPDLTSESINEIAEVVGIGAVKYADLSKNRLSDYIFNWDKMLSFEGNTAPYLQYAYARISSLLNKSGVEPKQLIQEVAYRERLEQQLAVSLLKFEEVLLQVIDSSNPHYLAGYLYQLATLFSRFYEAHDILKAPDKIKLERLALSDLTGRILKQGLDLLGINVLKRM